MGSSRVLGGQAPRGGRIGSKRSTNLDEPGKLGHTPAKARRAEEHGPAGQARTGSRAMVPRIRTAALAGLIAALAVAPPAAATDWLPISPDDLKMTSEPMAPGVPAVYLYRQVDRDDFEAQESAYVRIKILATDGLKYASVAIPFNKQYESIRDIEARTIRPDGSIVKFDGQVFEKPLLEAGDTEFFEKTFTLPAAEVGCIIEYRYVHSLRFGWIYDSRWILSADLFTRDARFSLVPYRYLTLRWSWPRGMPEGAATPKYEHNRITLEVRNVPALITEDHMPPVNEMQHRVDFIYSRDTEKDPAQFWQMYAMVSYRGLERFIDQRRAMAKALAEIVLPTDPPEMKLRKIYARVARIRDYQWDTPAEREAAKENPEKIRDAADVWERGYGSEQQIDWLFLALVRAAGMRPILRSSRDATGTSSTETWSTRPSSVSRWSWRRSTGGNIISPRASLWCLSDCFPGTRPRSARCYFPMTEASGSRHPCLRQRTPKSCAGRRCGSTRERSGAN
jgi:Domain of Unknown Function with PDB structure (DUF3857)